MKRFAVLAVVLGGCTPPDHAPGNTAAGDPAALPAPELDGAVALAGSWSFQAAASGDAASFGPPGGDPLFAVRCDRRARRIVFARVAVPGPTLRIVTGTAAASFPVTAGDPALPVEAADSVTDSFLDTLATAGGSIGVIVGAGPAATVPASPAIARVLAACRG